MKKLTALLALSLTAHALAGGSEGRSSIVFQRGQSWLMDTLTPDLAAGEQRLELGAPINVQKQTFDLNGTFLNYDPVTSQAEVLLLGDRETLQLCLTKANKDSSFSGVLLSGTNEQLVTSFYHLSFNVADYPTGQEIVLAAQKAKLGTCTLKRLR